MTARLLRRLAVRTSILSAALCGGLMACDNGATPTATLKGASALSRYYAIGTGLTMGAQGDGVLYDSQAQSWASLFAHGAGVTFTAPALRTPGCPAPRMAPARIALRLDGRVINVADTVCAGALGTDTLPLHNLALLNATAYDALHTTPKSITAAATAPYLDRVRYPLVLGNTQSQVTAMVVQQPSFVSLELGWAEVLRAIQRGRLVAASSYTQAALWTYVPAAKFDTVFRQIADSVTTTKARAVVLSVPLPSKTVGLRAGSELWTDRAALLTAGITVNADCNGSTNLVYTPAVVPILAYVAAGTGSARDLSCTDVPGTDDYILTAAELATLDAQVTAMNTTLQSVAQAKGWAFADLAGLFDLAMTARGAYRATAELGCSSPYGQYISLDGVHPNVVGNQVIASIVAEAVNTKYGFAFPTTKPTAVAAAQLCP
jgi:hypothetical protein